MTSRLSISATCSGGMSSCSRSHQVTTSIITAVTRIFINALMRVPGIRLEREPDMSWNAGLMSYELRNAIVATR